MAIDTSAKEYICPGERHPISRSIHLARLAASFPPCRECPLRDDARQVRAKSVRPARLPVGNRTHAAARLLRGRGGPRRLSQRADAGAGRDDRRGLCGPALGGVAHQRPQRRNRSRRAPGAADGCRRLRRAALVAERLQQRGRRPAPHGLSCDRHWPGDEALLLVCRRSSARLGRSLRDRIGLRAFLDGDGFRGRRRPGPFR